MEIMGINVYNVSDFMRACAACIQGAYNGDQAAYFAVERLHTRANSLTVSQEEFEACNEMVDALNTALDCISMVQL